MYHNNVQDLPHPYPCLSLYILLFLSGREVFLKILLLPPTRRPPLSSHWSVGGHTCSTKPTARDRGWFEPAMIHPASGEEESRPVGKWLPLFAIVFLFSSLITKVVYKHFRKFWEIQRRIKKKRKSPNSPPPKSNHWLIHFALVLSLSLLHSFQPPPSSFCTRPVICPPTQAHKRWS